MCPRKMIDFAEVRKSVERFCWKRGESFPFLVEAIFDRINCIGWLARSNEPRGARLRYIARFMMLGSSRGVQLKLVAEVTTDSNSELKLRTNTAELLDPGIWVNALERKSVIDDAISKH